jgi:DNA-binding IclR family transcriptional regulator
VSEPAGRTLKTARAVLRVLGLLDAATAGLSASQVAAELGRSRSTATNLLNTLVAEGFAEHDELRATYRSRSAQRWLEAAPGTGPDIDPAVVAELYARTRERAYLAVSAPPNVVIEESRGRQGLPYVPGLAPTISAQAHALAVGKAILAHLDDDALDTHAEAHGLTAFTPRTITDTETLTEELHRVRTGGVAIDVEEFAEGFCCIAAPVLDPTGHPIGAVAVSLTAARYRTHGERIARDVAQAARLAVHPATAET